MSALVLIDISILLLYRSLSNPVVSNNIILGGGSAGILIHDDGTYLAK